MQFCNEHGIAHSVFLNWHPEDRAKALAYLIHKSEQCQLCGTAEWEWTENPFAYEVTEKFCKGCHIKAVADDDRPRQRPGITLELTPTGTQESAQRAVRMAARYEAGELNQDAP
jgi:hypothetical protein